MKHAFKVIILCTVVIFLWIASLVAFSNSDHIKRFHKHYLTSFQSQTTYNNKQQGLNKEQYKSYLQQLRDQYAHKIPLPKMIEIPSGVFYLTSSERPSPDQAVDSFILEQYEIAETETTLEQWDTCVAFGGCNHLPDNYSWKRGDRPVLNVSYDDVQQYIAWINSQTSGSYRLPTENEWEYAARAGSNGLYPWGNVPPDCQNARLGTPNWKKAKFHDCKETSTWPVGQTAPNAWGLYDVIGNVAEWTSGCKVDIDKNELKQLLRIQRKKDPIDLSITLNIMHNCDYRANKGGNWMTSTKAVNVFHTRNYDIKNRYNRVGFRLARTVL